MSTSGFGSTLVPADMEVANGSVACIGVFDGVHRGHQIVIARARAVADSVAAGTGAFVPLVGVTFDPHPRAVLRPDTAPAGLCDLRSRVTLLRAAGCDAVLILYFTPALASLTPEEFVADVLVARLHVRAVVVGEGFRFGARAAGDAAMLAGLGVRFGFTVHEVPSAGPDGPGPDEARQVPVSDRDRGHGGQGQAPGSTGHRWSSTLVRALLADGDVAAAADVLGRPFMLAGTVVPGERRGRELGYPTANMAIAPGLVIPADGIYAAWIDAGGRRLPAAVSVGTNPQFGGRERTVEAYVIDERDLDLYGQELQCSFVARIRGQQVFADLAGLIDQMGRDVAACRRRLGLAGE